VTNLAFVPLASEAAHRTPLGSSALRESEASAAKRQRRSVSGEASAKRKSTTRFNEEPYY